MSAMNIQDLLRWSSVSKKLPPPEEIHEIHVYDFDNTLFLTPMPNERLWNSYVVGKLQAEEFLPGQGGWWHDPCFLEAIGEGKQIEQARAWEGFWNEQIVELVRLSMAAENTLTVLLTGRNRNGFSQLITTMLASKGLVFDIVGLKTATGPHSESFESTMQFKLALLRDVIQSYSPSDIRIYEDREKHVERFLKFLNTFALDTINSHARKQWNAKVILVAEQQRPMNPEVEIALVQKKINKHNESVRDGKFPRGTKTYKLKTKFVYSGYLIDNQERERLAAACKAEGIVIDKHTRFCGDCVLIDFRPIDAPILQRIGGMGAKMRFRVTELGWYKDNLWAARVQPVIPRAQVYTKAKFLYVVLLMRPGGKAGHVHRIRKWEPASGAFMAIEFDTTVGEKKTVQMEEEGIDDQTQIRYGEYKRKLSLDADSSDDTLAPLRTARDNKPFRQQQQQNGNRPSSAKQQNAAVATNESGNVNNNFQYPRHARSNNSNFASSYAPANQRGRGNFFRRGPSTATPHGRGNSMGRGRGGYRDHDASVTRGFGGDSMPY